MPTSILKLGVTGLARSGKTVFITSLVHNLLEGRRLPFLDAAAEGRIRKVYLAPQTDDDIPRFPYERNLEAITGADRIWPSSTNRISQLRLAIEFETNDFIWRRFGNSKLFIDIIDYPGEWLLDLPLLEMSFEEWCNQSFEMAMAPERRTISKDWVEFVSGVDPNTGWDERLVERGAGLFKRYLETCRSRDHALSTTPPGRFLMPGDLAGAPALTFCPLIPPNDMNNDRNLLWGGMSSRYEAYKKHIAEPFFRNHFSRLDRQIVLVDALHVLNSGASALKDMQRALEQILRCFDVGRNNWLSRLWSRRIDRIVFAATKADQLHHSNHDRLNAIMKRLTEDAVQRSEYKGAKVDALALASVRSTYEGEVTTNGERLPCIVGAPVKGASLDGRVFNGEEELAIFPGDLPDDPSELLDSEKSIEEIRENLQFVDFRPPLIPDNGFAGGRPLPNIRLDRALNFLLGDRLS